jgi:hypothetical protein
VKLVTTSVVRGSQQGQSHGGVYLIDLEHRSVRQTIDWNKGDIDWQGRGWDRGLRGIASTGARIHRRQRRVVRLTPDFRPAGSWRNAYLKQCHEIAVYQRTLYLTSTGCDSILGFDLDAQEFRWAMHVATDQFRFKGTVYDPRKQDGPLMLNKLHINSVHGTQGGMYITGCAPADACSSTASTCRWPPAAARLHNARPFRDGVLFNDTEADALRYAGRGEGLEDRAMPVPRYPDGELLNRDLDASGVARPGFARGLCVLSDSVVAGGSSPSTVTVYDLAGNERLLSVNITMDVPRSTAWHSWPDDSSDRRRRRLQRPAFRTTSGRLGDDVGELSARSECFS